MNSAAAVQTSVTSTWRMPLVPEQYDRGPLTVEERQAVDLLVSLDRLNSRTTAAIQARKTIARLQQPLSDVYMLRHPSGRGEHVYEFRRLMLKEMHQRGAAFWQWSTDDWFHLLRIPWKERGDVYAGFRASAIDVAYLLCNVTDLRSVGITRLAFGMAVAVFGSDAIDTAFTRVIGALTGKDNLGYTDHFDTNSKVRNLLSLLFLLNRSPCLEDVTDGVLEMLRPPSGHHSGSPFNKLVVSLRRLGIVSPAPRQPPTLNKREGEAVGMAQEWYEWCVAWAERTDISTTETVLGLLLTVGRWLQQHHPDIRMPEQWDEDLALEFTSQVRSWKVGQYATEGGLALLESRGTVGQPLSAATISAYLYAMRRFFSDLQRRSHSIPGVEPHRIPVRFVPAESFRTPRNIRRKLAQAMPRDIDMHHWAKLVINAAIVSQADLSNPYWYPLSLYRAMALLWTTTARRPNELIRLRLECVRRDWQPDMRDQEGKLLPIASTKNREDIGPPAGVEVVKEGTRICYLQVPSGKYRESFWIWIPDYVADAIDEWKKERPSGQPKLYDEKDREYVDYLFCLRGEAVGDKFINKSLIPTLCRKAGVPLEDAKGRITGHRGRSSRATFLRRVGVSLDDLAEYLGHADTRTIKRYAATDPLHLHRTIEQADDLSRIVRGVVDLEAVAQGLPALRWHIGYDADGEPMYCGNQAYYTCPHRLDCPKCGMFIGGDKARQLDAGENVLPVESRVPMTPIEKCVVNQDQRGYEAEKAKLVHVPAPKPQSNNLIFNPEGLSQQSWEDLARQGTAESLRILQDALSAHEARLAEALRSDSHNVLASTIRKKVARLKAYIADCEHLVAIRRGTASPAEGPSSHHR